MTRKLCMYIHNNKSWDIRLNYVRSFFSEVSYIINEIPKCSRNFYVSNNVIKTLTTVYDTIATVVRLTLYYNSRMFSIRQLFKIHLPVDRFIRVCIYRYFKYLLTIEVYGTTFSVYWERMRSPNSFESSLWKNLLE